METAARSTIRGIKGAIFDLDGTLLDSMDVWRDIDIDFLLKRGFEVPNNFMNEISGKSFRETAQYVVARFSLNESAESLMQEWHNMAIEKYSSSVKMFPYALEYLMELKQKGVKLGVATSLTKELYSPCLKANGALELFDVVCSVDEVTRGKEYPDIYLHVMKKLDVKPCDCMIFEDVLPAIKSAKQTGAAVFGINEKYSELNREEIIERADGYLYSFESAPVLDV